MLLFAEMWMDLQTVIQSEVSQKEKNIIQYRFYVESRKTVQINLFARRKESHRCSEQTYGYPEGMAVC